jgi:hypothetical protein
MSNHISEEGPRQGHAAGDTSVEQQASQLASDIKYKARQKMKQTSGSSLSPAQVQALYRQLLNASPAPGAVKSIVKQKLFKEQVDRGAKLVSETVKNSRSDIFGRVFVEGGGQKEEVIEEEDQKFVVRVTDKATGNTSYRKADRAKISQLRANPNISSVEITGRKKADDAYGEKHEKKYGSAKGKNTVGDKDGDGTKEPDRHEYAGVKDRAIKKAMAKEETLHEDEYRRELARERRAEKDRESKRGGAKSITPGKLAASTGKNYADSQMGSIKHYDKLTKKNKNVVGLVAKEEVIYEKEENGDKKLDVMKGKNTIKVNPTIGESIRAELDALKAQKIEEQEAAMKAAGPSPEERQQLMNKDKMLKKKIMMQKQTMQMQKQGRLPLNYNEESDAVRYCPKCDKDETRDECRYGGEYWDENSKPAKAEDPRGMKTNINLTKNKLRAMGLKMSYDMEGEMTEEASDRARDEHQMRGGMAARKDYDRPPAKKLSNKELGIRDFTPAEKAKRAKEMAAHLKKMRG